MKSISFSSKYLQFSVIYFNLLLLSDGRLLTSNKEFKSTLNILAIFFNTQKCVNKKQAKKVFHHTSREKKIIAKNRASLFR